MGALTFSSAPMMCCMGQLFAGGDTLFVKPLLMWLARDGMRQF